MYELLTVGRRTDAQRGEGEADFELTSDSHLLLPLPFLLLSFASFFPSSLHLPLTPRTDPALSSPRTLDHRSSFLPPAAAFFAPLSRSARLSSSHLLPWTLLTSSRTSSLARSAGKISKPKIRLLIGCRTVAILPAATTSTSSRVSPPSLLESRES